MKADDEQPYTAELEQWLRAVCSECEPAAELQARLAADIVAAAEYHETRELVNELRAVLRPEPLPRTLVATIERRIRSGGSYRVVRLLAPLCAAAAAAFAMAVVCRYDGTYQPPPGATAVALSVEDAADLVAANALLSWEGHFQTAVNEIASELDGLEDAADRISQAGATLPWPAEDDWDAVTTEGHSRAGFDCRA